MTCLVFTATLNEVENISTLINDCLTQLPTAHMLIVDDRSSDGTGELLDSLAKQYAGRVHVIHRPRKLGLGSAHKLAMKFALRHNYDFLITMDADYSHHPRYLPTMMKCLESADFVTGSRYVEGGRCDYGLGRQLISRTANFLARSLLGIPLHETTTSYRGFKRDLLERLPIDKIKAEGYAFFFESIFHACRIATNTSEFPIHFEDRRAGTSKISKKEVLKAMIRLSRLTARRALGLFKNYAPYQLPANVEPCDICQQTLHVELYAATPKSTPAANLTSVAHNSEMYSCTSAHHDSHGRIVRCLVCGLVATNPRLPIETLNAMYSDVIDHTYVANIPARELTFAYNFHKILNFIPKNARLLDIGSYYGVFLKIARGFGCNGIGIEPSKEASKFARDKYKLDIHSGTLANFQPEDARFDVISCWDVMEHFYSPMTELRQISAHVKSGGIFAFSTLNWNNWYARLLGERWPWLMDMHLYYFDDKIIEEMLRLNGFKLRMADTYSHIITVEYFLLKLDALGVPFAQAMRKILSRTPLAKIKIRFRFGDIRLYVAEKVADQVA